MASESTSGGIQCSCPIHTGTKPATLPLGVSFSHRVSIERVKPWVAELIYRNHHSYMPTIPDTNLLHHGIMLDGTLVGAVTYRFPLINKLILKRRDGENEAITDEEGEPVTRTYRGDEIVEVARICTGVDMPNLASCGFGKSQERFIERHAQRLGVGLLITFVRLDYDGSMMAALKGKGWRYDPEPREAGQASNRKDMEIRDHEKIRWHREIEINGDLKQGHLGDY